ncbi:MAG TPA: carbonic anhydrase [Gammaproteobacteria bacterium]|nr:carbonic anhydrase [Gammaproteobacteria bacterium]
MEESFNKIIQGYQGFRDKYVHGDKDVMQYLSKYGQQPKVMVVACCDSRVDPALILQCDPGDLFVVRNVANIVPPFEKDEAHHGTSAALEFGICFLQVKHLILLGHSQCGGIQALLNSNSAEPAQDDFITNWVSVIKHAGTGQHDVDNCAKHALNESYRNCLTFPWIKQRLDQQKLIIHLWFFDIQSGQIFSYNATSKEYFPLDSLDVAKVT